MITENFWLDYVDISLVIIEIAIVILITFVTLFVYSTRKQIKEVAKDAFEDYIKSEEGRIAIEKVVYKKSNLTKEKEED